MIILRMKTITVAEKATLKLIHAENASDSDRKEQQKRKLLFFKKAIKKLSA